MTTGNTTLLGLALPVEGELDGTWGDVVNDSITSLVDSAVAGTTTLSADSDVTLTTTVLAANQARQAVLLWTASNGATTRNITAPAQSKPYIVINAGTGSIVLRGAGPTTGVTIVAGEKCLAAWNGSDFVKIATTAAGAAAGSNTQVQFNSSGNLAGSSNLTFDGTNLALGGGTANGVAYLNGSKVLTTGSALTFDGFNQTLTAATNGVGFRAKGSASGTNIDATTSRGGTIGLYNLDTTNGNANAVEFYNSNELTSSYISGVNVSHSGRTGALVFGIANGSSPTEQMRLTSTGLGIGTSSPSVKLQVVSSGATGSTIAAYDATASKVYIQAGGASPTAAYVQLGVDGSNGTSYLNDYYGSGLVFQRAGTEAMRLDSTGLGIGTSSPQARFHSTAGATSQAGIFEANNSVALLSFVSNATSSYTRVQLGAAGNDMVLYTTGAERFRIGSAGQLGIGGANYGSSGQVLTSQGSGAAPIWATGGGSSQWTTTGSDIYYNTGNVLIGSTSFDNGGFSGSANGLNVVDATHALALVKETTTGNKVFVAASSTQTYLWTPSNTPMSFGTNDTERARITSGGNLLVGTTVNRTGANLTSAGGLGTANAVTNAFATVEYGSGASGTFTTITISFTVSSGGVASVILEILMTGFGAPTFLDYVAARYSAQALAVMRNNASSGTTVTGLATSDGITYTTTIATSVTHPVVKVKATTGGLSSDITLPTITFA